MKPGLPRIAPRIWRSPESDFYGDEILHAGDVYSDEVLSRIREEGFDGIWIRGQLYDLIASKIFPELNRPRAQTRRARLRTVIRRGQKHGVGVWLFFNEPLAIPSAHPFWRAHPEVKGASSADPFANAAWSRDARMRRDLQAPSKGPMAMTALCTSTSLGRRFFQEAVEQVLRETEGLEGVILITASEFFSHCWSHHVARPTGDAYRPMSPRALDCPRCRARGAATGVLDLLGIWRAAARKLRKPPRVLAWDWSWSMWYAHPQREIVAHLPKGVELLADWERGGTRRWRGRPQAIDEYSIGYVGPSRQFVQTRRAARGIPLHAKLQINTTHELATVPNLPLVPHLFDKWRGLLREKVRGVMGCWNFGCSFTLNTHAFHRFVASPRRWKDSSAFGRDLAASYFGEADPEALLTAWRHFGDAFDLYPFGFGFLYHSPINYAPAYPLTPSFHGRPMGPSWIAHAPWGDRLEDTLDGSTLGDVVGALESMVARWTAGLRPYRQALASSASSSEHRRHRREELGCAEMIGHHLVSTRNIYRLHQWKLAAIRRRALRAPCEIPLDAAARRILRDELANCRNAIPLVRADARLGVHQEARARFFTAASLAAKCRRLEESLRLSSGERKISTRGEPP